MAENVMAVDLEDENEILEIPTNDQDDLHELAPEEVVMEDAEDFPTSARPSEQKGVLLDDHHYFSDNESIIEKPKRLPRGTSNYQSAWYLDDFSDSGSDLENVEVDNEDKPMTDATDGAEDFGQDTMRDLTELEHSEYPRSEMFLDPSPEDESRQLAEYRSRRRVEAKEDAEFPDEIELNPNLLARERFARYRGLKSIRTSRWETQEDRPYEPEEWRRLLWVSDYKGAKSRVLREALVGGIKPGTRVNVHLRGVPLKYQQSHINSRPLALFSLLRHERKLTGVNITMSLSSDYSCPLRSKEEIIMQCGPRRFIINPLFSQAGMTPNNVHKFDRYLHPGHTSVASFIAPLTWGAVPVLFFKRNSQTMVLDCDDAENGMNDGEGSTSGRKKDGLELIGTGTCIPPSQTRVIARRVILTGHPYKIHKKLVTIRYMFFNAQDVQWFKALKLWTKRGRNGFIKESLGTHGHFKATFDGKINPMDAVGISLYKRVWPRVSRPWLRED